MTQIGNVSYSAAKFAEKLLWFQPKYLSLSLMSQEPVAANLQSHIKNSFSIVFAFKFNFP